MLYLTYLRQELRHRLRQAVLIATGLAVGVALVITVNAVATGAANAEAGVLHGLYGLGTDMTVTRPYNHSDTDPSKENHQINAGGPQVEYLDVANQGLFDESVAASIAALSDVREAVGVLALGETSNASPGLPTTIPVDGVDPAKQQLGPLSQAQVVSGRGPERLGCRRRRRAGGLWLRRGPPPVRGIGHHAGLARLPRGWNRQPARRNAPRHPHPAPHRAGRVSPQRRDHLGVRLGRQHPRHQHRSREDQGGAVVGRRDDLRQPGSRDQRIAGSDLLAGRGPGPLADDRRARGGLRARSLANGGLGLAAGPRVWHAQGARLVNRPGHGTGTGESVAIGVAGALAGIWLGYAAAALISRLASKLIATAAAAPGHTEPQGFVGGTNFKTGQHFFRQIPFFGTYNSVPVHFSAPVALGVVALAAALGIAGGVVAGALGSWRAARLRPTVALTRVG